MCDLQQNSHQWNCLTPHLEGGVMNYYYMAGRVCICPVQMPKISNTKMH